MSSILKALKKLESEKSRRDELSTAVASDILRSSRNKKSHIFFKVIAVCIGVVLIAAAGYYLAVKTAHVGPADSALAHPGVVQEAERIVVAEKLDSRPVPKPQATAQTTAVQNLPELSGIVYQDDPESRLAIINDLPVMEGTLVAEFSVKEILPDRVVLSKDNSEIVLILDPK